jgi:hypothetical protein
VLYFSRQESVIALTSIYDLVEKRQTILARFVRQEKLHIQSLQVYCVILDVET